MNKLKIQLYYVTQTLSATSKSARTDRKNKMQFAVMKKYAFWKVLREYEKPIRVLHLITVMKHS